MSFFFLLHFINMRLSNQNEIINTLNKKSMWEITTKPNVQAIFINKYADVSITQTFPHTSEQFTNKTLRHTIGYDPSACVSNYIELTNMNSEEFLNASYVKDYNINAFGPNEPFFIDECYSFAKDKSDLPRTERIKYYFINNATLCDLQNSALSIDYNTKSVNCSCSPFSQVENEREYNNTRDTLIEKLKYSFAERVLCYELLFNEAIIINNYGSWIFISLIGLSIINLIAFFLTSMNPIRSYFLTIYRKGLKENPSQVPTSKNFQIFFYNKSSQRYKSNSNLYASEIVQKQVYSLENYDDMEYEELLIYDQRGFCLHYCDYLLLIHPMLKTFYSSSIKSLRTIKISKFILNIALCCGLNSFLYFDKYIVNNYYNKGYLSALSNWPVSVHSYFLGIVFNIFMNFLSNNRGGINKVKKAHLSKHLEAMDNFFRKYTIKLTFFFIFHYVFLIIMWYIMAIFCIIYPNNQIQLLINALMTFALAQIFPFFAALFIAMAITMCINQRRLCWFNVVRISTYFI